MTAVQTDPDITSPANPRVKNVVRLRQRSHRDEDTPMLIEGYREISRALDNRHPLTELYFCEARFQGSNNAALLDRARDAGASLVSCAGVAFDKMAYRDRPDGLLALAPPVRHTLDDIPVTDCPFIVVAEAIEKPGNLGTILRSADAAGVDGVIVCDRCTDINNPNVVRASVGTLFSLPVVEATSADALEWLRARGIQTVAATPHTDTLYCDADLSRPTAIIVGTEQYGLSSRWMESADVNVRIPMLGQADSLNVASAVTILLYETVRQRTRRSG
jgi:TrmH family RNA methyltransferase